MADEARRSARQRTPSARLFSQTKATPDRGRKVKKTARVKPKQSTGSPARRRRPKKGRREAVEEVTARPGFIDDLTSSPPTQALDNQPAAAEEEEEAAPAQEQPFLFDLCYSAIAGKEELPASIRTRRATWPGEDGYSMFDLDEWKLEVLLRQRPRQCKIVNVRLTAGYEGCKEVDKVRSDAYED